MKRVLVTILVVTMLVTALPGLTGCKIKPKNWYQATLDYYSEGVKSGWANEDPSLMLNISDDLKTTSSNKQIGYLLVDLDEDGTDELLIGFNDGSNATKFTDVIVWHSDMGAFKAEAPAIISISAEATFSPLIRGMAHRPRETS